MTPFHARTLATTLAVSLGIALAPSAQAITFDILGESGDVVGTFTPDAADWILAPGSGSGDIAAQSGGGFEVLLGQSVFGASEVATQDSHIYGAGLILPATGYGYRVNFSANLRTWDSYNIGESVQPLPGGSLGYWDLFAVNANTSDYYWNLVDQGIGSPGEPVALLRDSLVPMPPAGSVVRYTNPGDNAAALPGATWAWGGRDFAAGYFESIRTSSSVTVAASAPVFVSFVLDTATRESADNRFPSWGAFGVAGQFADVPDGAQGSAPGLSANNPLLPVDGNVSDGHFVFDTFVVVEGGPGTASFLFVDPVVAVGYEYQVSGGPSFAEVLLPTLGDADGYGIEVRSDDEWVLAGTVGDGGSFTFAAAVNRFRVMGIDPALGLDPMNPVAFVTGLKFDATGPVQIEMTAVTAAVPEPETYAMLGLGLALIGLRRARRGRSVG